MVAGYLWREIYLMHKNYVAPFAPTEECLTLDQEMGLNAPQANHWQNQRWDFLLSTMAVGGEDAIRNTAPREPLALDTDATEKGKSETTIQPTQQWAATV